MFSLTTDTLVLLLYHENMFPIHWLPAHICCPSYLVLCSLWVPENSGQNMVLCSNAAWAISALQYQGLLAVSTKLTVAEGSWPRANKNFGSSKPCDDWNLWGGLKHLHTVKLYCTTVDKHTTRQLSVISMMSTSSSIRPGYRITFRLSWIALA